MRKFHTYLFAVTSLRYREVVHSFLFAFCLLSSFSGFGQNQYLNLLDSASKYLQKNPDSSLSYLKKIPEPLAKSIKGKVAEYFESKAFAYYHKDNFGLAYRNMLLAAKHAENEKKFKFAGELYVEAYTLHQQIEKRSNNDLLEKATTNFKKVKDKDGLLEVNQARIYSYYLNKDYRRCIDSSLLKLDDFRKADNLMIDLVANYLVASSYFKIDSLSQALKYYKIVQKLEFIEADGEEEYFFHVTALNYELANFHFRQKNLDSSFHYLNKVGRFKRVLDYAKERDYYLLGIEVSRVAKKPEMLKAYMDSLQEFERLKHESSLQESLKTNENLVKVSENLDEVKSKNKFYQRNIIMLVILSVVLLILIVLFRLKIRSVVRNMKAKIEDSLHSKKQQQKLSTKVNQLEVYISEIKSEIRNISKEESSALQRTQLQNVYTDINVKLNQLSEKDHLYVVNEMNDEFFNRLKKAHPEFMESELLICYYLSLGFKNKEIAVFLDTSVRAVEGKRFRVRKKIESVDGQENIIDYLNELMK